MEEKKFIVYVLRSCKTGFRYIGQTNNLERRLQEHENGDTKSIRFQRPFTIEYIEKHPTRLEAMRRERWLKTGVGREWLDDQKN
jgi:putative endonuclease